MRILTLATILVTFFMTPAQAAYDPLLFPMLKILKDPQKGWVLPLDLKERGLYSPMGFLGETYFAESKTGVPYTVSILQVWSCGEVMIYMRVY